MKNSTYWANRMRLLEKALLDDGYEYVQNLEKQYDEAIKVIEQRLAVWYQRFAANNEISLAEAKRMLTTGELKEFKWTVADYIARGEENAIDGIWAKQLENASARVHISRLDSLKMQIQQEAEALYGKQLAGTESVLSRIYENGYYHTAFEIQVGTGLGWSLQSLNPTMVEKVLSRPWTIDGQTFRDRCWTNKQALVNSVNTQLTQMIMRGEAPDKAIKAISQQFNVAKNKAGRLVMTESAAFSSAAQKDCFTALDVEQYRIVGTLDEETCGLCADLDGKVYKMSDFSVGSTAPPFHPWCRCTTCPHFDDMESGRFARDVDGKRYSVPADMTYKEWYNKTIAANPAYRLKEQMHKNKWVDIRQYEKYKNLLGDEHMYNSVEAFQRVKYSDPAKYQQLQREYRTVGKIKRRDCAETYKQKLYDSYYDFRNSGIEMTDHALDRFLGQKKGKTPFTKDDVCDIMKKQVNYLQESDGRMIRHYPPLSAATNASTDEVITIVTDRKQIRSDWREIK